MNVLPDSQNTEVDFILIADFAEVINGKLYLQGGGWDTLNVTTPLPARRSVGIAVGIEVPWEDTNRRYAVGISVLSDDTRTEFVRVDAQLETGRPAGIARGQSQLVLVAFNAAIEFPATGLYLVVVSIDGDERRTRVVRVVQ